MYLKIVKHTSIIVWWFYFYSSLPSFTFFFFLKKFKIRTEQLEGLNNEYIYILKYFAIFISPIYMCPPFSWAIWKSVAGIMTFHHEYFSMSPLSISTFFCITIMQLWHRRNFILIWYQCLYIALYPNCPTYIFI